MGAFTVGTVYADFTNVKNRPALVVGLAEFNNLIVCQITSQQQTSQSAILLSGQDFIRGSLHVDSFVRPDKLFTIETSVVRGVAGVIADKKLSEIKSAIRSNFT